MKVWVQCARSGSRAKAAAIRAAAGARRSALQPRKDSQTRSPSPARMPRRPMRSAQFAQSGDVERRTDTQVGSMGCEKGLGRPATLVAQHAQEVPLGVELRGITKLRHDFAGYAMNAHLRPAPSLGCPGSDASCSTAIIRSSLSSGALNETSL